jgi:flagellar hook-associated protein 2
MPISASGFGSALDINAIVSQLMTLEQRPLTLLANEQGMTQSRISSWGKLKGALASLQGVLKEVHSLDRFKALKAAVGDATVATAAAGASATPGTYTLEVLALAQQHKLRSEAFASSAETLGGGTLTFQYGAYDSGANTFTLNASKAAQSVTIAAGSSLAAVRDAVNAAGIGVSASIVNDGSGDRLVFGAKDAGAASSLKVTVADGDGNDLDASGLSRLAYDPTAGAGSGKNLTQAAAAQDASLRIDGVTVTKSSNVITDAIAGVTLTLAKTNPGTPTTVTVQRDTESVKKTVESFVSGYNDAYKVLKDLTAYNAETKQAGLLQGDAVATSILSRMRATLNAALTAFSGTFTSLAQIGVAFQKDGTLALDAAKLQAAMDSAYDDIAGLFTCVGKLTGSGATFRGYSAATQAGSYAVAVTQLATRGTLAGSQAAGLTITAGVNDTLSLTVDGVSATVTLAAGTYASASALAAEVQTRANGAAALVAAGAQVSVTQSGGVLTVTSARYGSSSTVAVSAGAAATNLLGNAPAAAAGVDVAGTINGVAAAGSGRILTGAGGDPSEGLALEIDAAAPGTLGTVSFSRGHAHNLDELMQELLDAEGAIASRTEGLNARLKALDKRKAELNNRLADIERRYRAQYVALDAMLQRMNTTSSFLANQLAALPGTGT